VIPTEFGRAKNRQQATGNGQPAIIDACGHDIAERLLDFAVAVSSALQSGLPATLRR
jgi:hypothetical protein